MHRLNCHDDVYWPGVLRRAWCEQDGEEISDHAGVTSSSDGNIHILETCDEVLVAVLWPAFDHLSFVTLFVSIQLSLFCFWYTSVAMLKKKKSWLPAFRRKVKTQKKEFFFFSNGRVKWKRAHFRHNRPRTEQMDTTRKNEEKVLDAIVLAKCVSCTRWLSIHLWHTHWSFICQ